jgi:crossover junction endodeoxyribonuclease RuvC
MDVSSKPLRILGIDPGSRRMGYAVIELIGKQPRCLFHDTLVIIECSLAEKLGLIFKAISGVIQDYQPDEVAIEQVFLEKNVQSALKLGQARGAAIAAVGFCHLPLAEYAARQIKQAVVGFGGAEKEQVQLMVRSLLKLTERLPPDSADALAIALCHSFQRTNIVD